MEQFESKIFDVKVNRDFDGLNSLLRKEAKLNIIFGDIENKILMITSPKDTDMELGKDFKQRFKDSVKGVFDIHEEIGNEMSDIMNEMVDVGSEAKMTVGTPRLWSHKGMDVSEHGDDVYLTMEDEYSVMLDREESLRLLKFLEEHLDRKVE